ncbi:HAMP domain-containing histidine kinase [Lysobacter sp. GX 14042]|uniref:sensor histidine kinase n=1 Tax=Lysobacter sp. GX 14042 TaxID=2907155 RepID=UPI001F43E779|nr:HAMP domain-containing sensor histidine kinase [Lysobacter sp. GX 14042]MCE7031101.1 HAMP domain-containing histidine kinase [Lysobacter sp. GX 14042]
MSPGLPRRIKLAFIAQAAVASVLITIGIVLAGVAVRGSVLDERMQREADIWWSAHASGTPVRLPHTSTMAGYFAPAGGEETVPAHIRGLEPGRHRVEEDGRPGVKHDVLVDRREPGTFYLSFEAGHIDRAILWTGLASLLLSLAATYLMTWLTYRTSKRMVLPVSWLSRVVSRWDPRHPDTDAIRPGNLPDDAGAEVHQLSRALLGLAERVGDFVERERDFTRDASHELRTPLTVIRVAADMMIADPDTPARTQRSLARIQRAGRDMEAVIDAFLILAREAGNAPQSSEFDVAAVAAEQVERMRPLAAGKPVEIGLVDHGATTLFGPAHVLAVMLGNLLSNAVKFTEQGRVEVHLYGDRIEVRDTGIGMDPETLSNAFKPFFRADVNREQSAGMGLSIARRLGERLGWPVSLESLPGDGTLATIRFMG